MCRLYSRYELSNEYQPANSEPPTHPHCKVLSTLLSGSIGKCISGCIQNMLNFCLNSSPAQRRNRSELLVRAISVWHLRSSQNKEWSQVIPAQGSSLPCHWWSLVQTGGPSWPSGARPSWASNCSQTRRCAIFMLMLRFTTFAVPSWKQWSSDVPLIWEIIKEVVEHPNTTGQSGLGIKQGDLYLWSTFCPREVSK